MIFLNYSKDAMLYMPGQKLQNVWRNRKRLMILKA